MRSIKHKTIFETLVPNNSIETSSYSSGKWRDKATVILFVIFFFIKCYQRWLFPTRRENKERRCWEVFDLLNIGFCTIDVLSTLNTRKLHKVEAFKTRSQEIFVNMVWPSSSFYAIF